MRKLPKFITLEEFNKIIDLIEKEKPCNYKLHLLAIILGFKAGMRISEIVGYETKKDGVIVPKLESKAIDVVQHSIRIESGKGHKDRIVPLPKGFKEEHIKLLPLKVGVRALEICFKRTCIQLNGSCPKHFTNSTDSRLVLRNYQRHEHL